jgi:hypothetical protein
VRASPSSITAAFPLSNADGENSSRRPRQTNVPPCNCRLHACERSCLRSAAVFGLSNDRVFGGAPLSVPARPCICFFFSPGEHFRGKFQAVFCFFEGRSRARQTPAASTNASRHAGEIGRHGVDMPWSVVSQNQTNQTAARKLTSTDMGESLDMHVMYSSHSHTRVLSTD